MGHSTVMSVTGVSMNQRVAGITTRNLELAGWCDTTELIRTAAALKVQVSMTMTYVRVSQIANSVLF